MEETTNSAKQPWTDPKVVVFGDIEQLTLSHVKQLNLNDGFTFGGSAIGNVSG
jgi:hypothetical protein